MKSDAKLLSDLGRRGLDGLLSLLVGASGPTREGLAFGRRAGPDHASGFDALADRESGDDELFVQELFILLKILGAVVDEILPALVSENEALVALCDVARMESLDVVGGRALFGGEETHVRHGSGAEEALQIPLPLLVGGARHDEVVDAEVDLGEKRAVLGLEPCLLDETDNLLEAQGIAVKLSVYDRASGKSVDVGLDVIQMRKGLGVATEGLAARRDETPDAVQLALGVAGPLDVLAALVVGVG